MEEAYCGIDVAFAKRKWLPVAVCTSNGSALRALPLRGTRQAPRGLGNRAALDPNLVAGFARATLDYLRRIERTHSVSINRVAIDAPRDYAPEGQRRLAEAAMDRAGISCFATPSRAQFELIRKKAEAHLSVGGAESRLPHANQLWMLVGFEIFRVLEPHFDCIEVFPQAAFRALDSAIAHKSGSNGLARQIELLSMATGLSIQSIDHSSDGARHDRTDARLAAWIASLNPQSLAIHGDGRRDTIWSVAATRSIS
jgi:predicted nuclease with RNAse H fold